ncbi:hypothetical protein GB931_04325 [Modestobacter sp. I12A-02628]|uniref:Copper resistance protein CopC n=1 Tax=Goekera deserti TaxID=2497753 RepID=A0A7K3WDJ6_9ACTN|nr:copper resistance CopC family protein [Goekera deserti]MPQ97164.1 hypothetical protein [Goekera deserti]NDI46518.1 hypothetical protein [Goekera deserti]NEL54548.1 copper resistance protein CopC [Goekera deserti]
MTTAAPTGPSPRRQAAPGLLGVVPARVPTGVLALVPALVLALVLSLALVLGTATDARAHTRLVSTDPADGSTVVAPPSAVTLTFGGAVRVREVLVTGPTGVGVGTAAAVADGAVLTQPVALLEAGLHTVAWSVGAGDGHRLEGTLSFTYAPTPAPTPAAGTTPTPAAAPAPPATDPAPSPLPAASEPAAARPASPSGVPAWLPAGGGVLLAAAAVLVTVRRRRNRG